MKTIKVYKYGKEFACKENRAKHLVANEGYSLTRENTSPRPRKTKAKVQVQSDVRVDSPFNDGEPINTDLGEFKTEE